MRKQIKKVVLAYSGGLDTSIIIPYLKETYGCEVIAYAADVGQGEELRPLRKKAIKTGASKIYIEDLRKEFVKDYIWPMVKSGAVYEGLYLLGTSVARPLIAKRQVEIAWKEGADAVAHGCTGKGNDQVRFELTFKAMDPSLTIVAPWRDWDIKSREDAIDYAAARNIPLTVTKKKNYSEDRNLWHISHEGGILEDPWVEAPEDVYTLSVSPVKAPNKPEYVIVDFVKGIPVGLNGKRMDGVSLIEKLNKLGGRNGVGRVDLVENRLVGMKSRGIYETPGGTILMVAHASLETLTLDKETMHLKEQLGVKYAELVYNGQWFTPVKKALDAFVNSTQERVTGRVQVKLFKGTATAVGREAKQTLYSEDLATFAEDAVYNQADSRGFINLFGLPTVVNSKYEKISNVKKKKK